MKMIGRVDQHTYTQKIKKGQKKMEWIFFFFFWGGGGTRSGAASEYECERGR